MSSQRSNRREFLRSGAAAGVFSSLALPWAGVSASQAPRWKMRLSCSSINFASLPIEKAD